MDDPIRTLFVIEDPGADPSDPDRLARASDCIEVTTEPVADAIEHLSTSEVDCVVADYDLPGYDGLAFLEAVRDSHPQVPFVLFTDDGSEQLAGAAVAAGATGYLPKSEDPDTYQTLAARIEESVDRVRGSVGPGLEGQTTIELLSDLYAVTTDTELTFEEKITRLLGLGCDRLGLAYGFLSKIDPGDGDETDGTQRIVLSHGDHTLLQPGSSCPLSEAYCRKTIQRNGLLGVQDAVDEGFASDPAYERFSLGCYLGGKVVVNEELYGTLCFAGSESREYSFTESEQAFVELLVQWAGYELAQNRLEEKLRDLQEVAGELMEADSIDEVGDVAVESAEEILGLEITGIWSYDEQQEALIPISETPAARDLLGSSPRYEPGSSLTWTVFERGEKAVFEDVSTVQGRYNADTDIRAEVIVPLGDQGVIVTGSVSEQEFSDTDIGLFELFGSTITSAMLRMEREQALQETRAKLERSNEDLEQFAYVASHDLQEPLRTVSSYLQLLERRYRDDFDEDGQEFIDFAVNGAERMSEMIQALLEYSRVDTRGDPLSPTSMDEVYETAHQNLRVAIDQNNATVTADRLPTVQGDEQQLVRLLQNLLDNAIKYAGDTEPRVHISAERTDDKWAFAVEDNGIGMTAKDTERIFQVFERLHGRESYSGTGIGLAMCRKIVDRHGGDIWVESERGEGSTFHFTLHATTDD